MQDILRITDVLACLGADQEGSTEVWEAIEVVVCEDFDLTVKKPEWEMYGFEGKFKVFADFDH